MKIFLYFAYYNIFRNHSLFYLSCVLSSHMKILNKAEHWMKEAVTPNIWSDAFMHHTLQNKYVKICFYQSNKHICDDDSWKVHIALLNSLFCFYSTSCEIIFITETLHLKWDETPCTYENKRSETICENGSYPCYFPLPKICKIDLSSYWLIIKWLIN